MLTVVASPTVLSKLCLIVSIILFPSSYYSIMSSNQLLNFAGKVAVITGAARGLGREYALLLASRGASVVGVYLLPPKKMVMLN